MLSHLTLLFIIVISAAQYTYSGTGYSIPQHAITVATNTEYTISVTRLYTVAMSFNIYSTNGDSFKVEGVNSLGNVWTICPSGTASCVGSGTATLQSGMNKIVITNTNYLYSAYMSVTLSINGDYGFTYPGPNSIFITNTGYPKLITWNWPFSLTGTFIMSCTNQLYVTGGISIGSGSYAIPSDRSSCANPKLQLCNEIAGTADKCDLNFPYITISPYSENSNVCYGTTSALGCSNHGYCQVVDQCTCTGGYTGNRCQNSPQFTCYGKGSTDPTICSGKGQCVGTDSCSCQDGYAGNECQTSTSTTKCFGIVQSDPIVCNGRGVCKSPDLCVCTQNGTYTGNQCQFMRASSAQVVSPTFLMFILVGVFMFFI